MLNHQKEILKNELSYIVNLGSSDVEIYDNLTALLEVLRVQEIISNEAYDDAEIKVSELWGYDTPER